MVTQRLVLLFVVCDKYSQLFTKRLQMGGRTVGRKTNDRKTHGRTDIWPIDIQPRGYMTERHLAETTFERKPYLAEQA